ncbi:hypothetical protein FRC0337_01608 [Corynebacterium diphtheriae]|nr:hypothetical protein FRC0337_01608 [Corynebacterium diphtheriae]
MTRRPWKWRPIPLGLVSGHVGLVRLFQETPLLVSCQTFSFCTTTSARLVHHRARSWQKARHLAHEGFVMPDFARIVQDYRPRALSAARWQVVAPFVRPLALDHLVPTAVSAESLRNDTLALAWTATIAVEHLGAQLTVEDVLSPSTIEYAIGVSPWTTRVKGARRSTLVALGRALNPEWPFGDTAVAYGYEAPDAPYTAEEHRQLVQWSYSLGTDYQRASARTYLALGLGAGLRSKEMATLTRSDVTVDAAGVLVTARGYRGAGTREVPVRAEWEQVVGTQVRALPTSNSLVLFPQRAHATTESVAAILTRIGKPEHIRLDSRRLRTTWVVALLQEFVPEAVVASAAGLASLQHFTSWLPEVDTRGEQARALLRGGLGVVDPDETDAGTDTTPRRPALRLVTSNQ